MHPLNLDDPIDAQGATVLDPICGIHNMVGVVDFSAMYPSIMRAHNICASTIILDEKNPVRSDEGLLRVCGHVFVSETHVKGLIPEVVELLQHCRTKAKKAYAEVLTLDASVEPRCTTLTLDATRPRILFRRKLPRRASSHTRCIR